MKYGICYWPLIVIALGEQYSNYRKFVKQDSVTCEVVPLTHSVLYICNNVILNNTTINMIFQCHAKELLLPCPGGAFM